MYVKLIFTPEIRNIGSYLCKDIDKKNYICNKTIGKIYQALKNHYVKRIL